MTPSPQDSQWTKGARFAGLGTEFGGIIVAGVVAGYYIDEWLGTSPLFLLVFTLGGFAGALARLIRMLKRFN